MREEERREALEELAELERRLILAEARRDEAVRDFEELQARIECNEAERRREVDVWAEATLDAKALELYRRAGDSQERLFFKGAFGYGAQAGFAAGFDAGFKVGEPCVRLLAADFDKLSVHQRRVVGLVAFHGWNYEETAEALGITAEGVRYHMKQAAKALGLTGVDELREAVSRGVVR